jgi:tungstate transport system ATP-binding protein
VPPPDAREAILPLAFEGVGYAVRGAALLSDLSFVLEAGPCSVILGPNGAGKSLTLRLADGLLAPTAGRVRWLGAGGARAAEAKALVFQRPVLLRRSAAANVDYALRLRGLPRAARARRTEQVLAATGLLDRAERPARGLSGGEQQRLALARAWALEPQVLFLDEPASALDPAGSRALEESIRAVRAEGTKIVMTTHDLAQAERMADEVLFLHRGHLVERAPAAAFFHEPRSPEAKAFLRAEALP